MDTTTSKKPRQATARANGVSIHLMGCFPRCKCMCGGAFCACRESAPVIVEPSADNRALGARVQ